MIEVGVFLALTVGALSESHQAEPATLSVEAFLDQLANKRQDIAVMKARFAMENVTPDETRQSIGELLYVKPRRLVFHIFGAGKLDLALLLDGQQIYEYDPELEQLQIYHWEDNTDMDALFAAFESDPKALRTAYDIELFEPQDQNRDTIQGVVLRPKGTPEEKGRLFEQVRLFLGKEDYLPVGVHIVNDPESEVFLEFNQIEINHPVRPEETQIAVPPGTKVIENEDRVRTIRRNVHYFPEPLVPNLPAAPPESPSPEQEPDLP